MSHAGSGIQQFGAAQSPALDTVAQDVLATARRRMEPRAPYRPPLTEQERSEAEAATADLAKVCKFCIGIHPLPGGPGCPRLLTFRLDGDGRVVEGTYRTDDLAWQARVVLLEDAHEDGTEEEAGDGG